ncbi:MAG TPA: hypothetical protein VFB31_07280 [Pseudolabrys sp.]|nr:hypothetical protein [Pseudolabrys sp.]
MSSPRQGNLFGGQEPGGPIGNEQPPAYRPDLDDVRARLHKLLAKARSADKLPPDTLLVYRAIIPHMTGWLPEDEGAQLRLQFDSELERLEKAA